MKFLLIGDVGDKESQAWMNAFSWSIFRGRIITLISTYADPKYKI